MRVSLRAAAVAVACIAAAGCMTTTTGDRALADRADAPLGPTLGQAVATMDNQIIDPTPAQGPPAASARRAVLAIERYEAGKVLTPQLSTSAFQGGEAGGAGGGAAASSSGVSK